MSFCKTLTKVVGPSDFQTRLTTLPRLVRRNPHLLLPGPVDVLQTDKSPRTLVTDVRDAPTYVCSRQTSCLDELVTKDDPHSLPVRCRDEFLGSTKRQRKSFVRNKTSPDVPIHTKTDRDGEGENDVEPRGIDEDGTQDKGKESTSEEGWWTPGVKDDSRSDSKGGRK